MQTNIKSFILQCILSTALWKLLTTGFLWIDLTYELFIGGFFWALYSGLLQYLWAI